MQPPIRLESYASKGERLIARVLERNGLRFEYEARLAGYKPDFYLPDHGIVIEYWGMTDAAYIERRLRKTERFLAAGLRVVSIEPTMHVVDQVRRKLGPLLPRGVW